jgi:hypothetical protein
MALRTLLALALAANASAYEWFAVMKLTHEAEYALTLKTLDESMKFYIAELGTSYDAASLDALVDGAEAYMSTYCSDVVADAGVIESDAEQVCKTLAMGSGLTSTYELHIEEHAHRRRLSGDEDVYFAVFAEHAISEWEDDTVHFLKCGASAACGDVVAGADVETDCDGDTDHSGHDHGRRLAACPVPSASDGAARLGAAAALALAGLALVL